MKKTISFVLVLALFFVLLSGVTSTAATIPSIYMRPVFNSDKTALTVEVYTNGLRWTEFDGGIKFDPSAMTLISVNEGGKIVSARAKAQEKGFDIITASRDVAKSNEAGYCNFIAVSGWKDCNMTFYAGSVVFYTFSVKDLEKAKTGYHLCINTLTDANGKSLASYASFDLSTPVVYLPNEKNPFLYGDLNQDGIDVYDAMLVLQFVVGTTTLEEYQKYAAKVSGESEISIYDAMLILQRVVGVVTTFPVEG